MKISHFGGIDYIDTIEEMKKILNTRFGDDVNEFWITDNESENPCLVILINKAIANLTYFPEDGHPGFQSFENENGLDSNGYSIFYTNTPEEEIEISNEMVVPVELALKTAKEFFESMEMPTSIKWMNLQEV